MHCLQQFGVRRGVRLQKVQTFSRSHPREHLCSPVLRQVADR